MSKAKQADVPAIYPLKGEHKKPEHVKHVKPEEVKDKNGEHDPAPEEPLEIPKIKEYTEVPEVHDNTPKGETNIYQTQLDEQVRRPNPLLEPSSYPQVMSKQLPKYGGLLKPQPIEIELRGR